MYMVSRITCQYIFYSKNIIFTLDATIHLTYIDCKETEKGNEQMDALDKLITTTINHEHDLSAESINALHGATSTHPWCKGKALRLRCLEVLCATAGRDTDATSRYNVERLFKGTNK